MSALEEWGKKVFARYVDDVYDDPFYELESFNGVREGVKEMKAVAGELGLDFDQVVEQNTTEYERRRVAYIIQHGRDMPL
jgi:hypothetical protein